MCVITVSQKKQWDFLQFFMACEEKTFISFTRPSVELLTERKFRVHKYFVDQNKSCIKNVWELTNVRGI